MKKTGALLFCLLLTGCDQPNDTQLMTETGRQLQRTIDASPARGECEDIAKGRERLSRGTRKKLEEKGCQFVLRSATETNFAEAAVFHSTMTMVCGSITGKSFTGSDIRRRFIYSPEERALVIEPMTPNDKTRFEQRKTLTQLQADFARQQLQYCK
ncbi:hypothetical protein BBB56_15130 [Candidatus Pantoea deserta]|uniref:Lipoprotein n=1 Tax=Candidatus Pantoea deserta TaxID=1869313 RepID=A0A3N4P3I7_9GAMM|nr:hypothetical protein [Pantoea deserta]RPD98349.1 hypothetical protein BBB56_15130 [Pantoea deserta]